jgi:hypothetical protein
MCLFRLQRTNREAKLATAKVQRDEVLASIRKANSAIDAGDKLARNALPALNKASLVAGRLVLSIEPKPFALATSPAFSRARLRDTAATRNASALILPAQKGDRRNYNPLVMA